MEWISSTLQVLGDNGTAIVVALVTFCLPVVIGRAARESRSNAKNPHLVLAPAPLPPEMERLIREIRADVQSLHSDHLAASLKLDFVMAELRSWRGQLNQKGPN